MLKHTPTPWVVYKPDDYQGPNSLPGLGVEAENGEAVVWYAAHPDEGLKNDADAAHIVRCVNAHKALVEALQGMLSNSLSNQAPRGQEAVRAARAALALAEGEAPE